VNPPLWSASGLAAVSEFAAFLLCCAYGVYSWFQVLRNRQPGVQWVGLTGRGLTDLGQRYLRRFYGAMVVGIMVGWIGWGSARNPSPTPSTEPPEGMPQPTQEVVWEAVLAAYATHTFPSIADSVRSKLPAAPSGQLSPAPVVLLPRRDSTEAPYHRPWLQSLVTRSLVTSVCPALGPGYCPEGEVKTYLELHDPQFVAEDTALVAVYEQGVDWSSCGHWHRSVGGDLTVEFLLARVSGGWTIISRHVLDASTISC
jgi:hypothetical protein